MNRRYRGKKRGVERRERCGDVSLVMEGWKYVSRGRMRMKERHCVGGVNGARGFGA